MGTNQKTCLIQFQDCMVLVRNLEIGTHFGVPKLYSCIMHFQDYIRLPNLCEI